MQPYLNPPAYHTQDVFGRDIEEGTLVAVAGVRKLIIGQVYRMPDYTKEVISIGVKSITGLNKESIQLGYNYGKWPLVNKFTRILILDDSYLDL